VKLKLVGVYATLLTANVVALAAALALFRESPLLLGTALLAYGLGLRHAVDADHIAAIDNITRKLIQEGKRPVGVGFLFSLGHSTIVIAASLAIAAAAATVEPRFTALRGILGIVGTSFSALILFAIALMNLVVLLGVYRTFARVRDGKPYAAEDLNALLAGSGLLARLFRPLFGMVRRGWHIYLIGLLFGLGFDTATEVAAFGISATQAMHGMGVWSILVFPALFTAGMSLVDTTDGVLMLGVYGWAFVRPIRRLFYNMTITFVSVVLAALVGGIEAMGLAVEQLDLKGPLWDAVAGLNDKFGTIGYVIIAVFALSWVGSVVVYRARGYDRLEPSEPS
jgi:high-affinity nickel-transport protein